MISAAYNAYGQSFLVNACASRGALRVPAIEARKSAAAGLSCPSTFGYPRICTYPVYSYEPLSCTDALELPREHICSM